MSEREPPGDAMPRRVLLIGTAVIVMAGIVVGLGPSLLGRGEEPTHPAALPMASPGDPIAAEADVFRTRPSDLAVEPAADRRGGTHRRKLATFRALRAFPGAPPRIPHGLTEAEYRTTGCNACHERGGYVARFGAYTPITPHPELSDCLQCHLPDAAVVGIEFPAAHPDALCLQCHAPGATTARFVPVEWRPAAWPATGQRALPGSPPPIPHDLQLRGNCLACHMGPAAVEEIRTTHPERANCRQCHVAAPPEAGVFVRTVDGSRERSGGGR